MCGISGYFSFKEACDFEVALSESVSKIRHRGPDCQGVLIFKKAGLGHARLSIIDLSERGNQPMETENKGRAITYNGEVYNYQNLRRLLQDKGLKFSSQSDTEVILKGYEVFGASLFEQLDGMFAIAIYDAKKHELILVRDRFGMKPLYYFKDNKNVYFASEMGALLDFPIDRILDKDALSLYLKYNYIPGNASMIKGVRQVKPGTFLVINENGISEKTYYELKAKPIEIPYKQAVENIAVLLGESVKNRLIADVPVASFLSGGLDSSAISMLASSNHHNIQTYSAGFSDYPYFDETKYGIQLAEEINTRHHIFDLSEDKISSAVENVLNSFSEPFADTSAIAYYLLSKHTADHVKVVLSGDGADEVFGGYRKHKAEWMFQNNKLITKLVSTLGITNNKTKGSRNSFAGEKRRQLKKWLNGAAISAENRYFLWASIQNESDVRQLFDYPVPSILFRQNNFKSMNDVLQADMQLVLPGDMLTKADRMSMQFGLEVRTPFLDHHLVDFIFSLPSKWKLKGGNRKNLLKEALKGKLPDYILNRSKKGFEVPLWAWLNGPLREVMFELLSEDNIKQHGLFNTNRINELINRSMSSNPGDAPSTVWALMVFQVWFNNYKPHIEDA